MVSDLGLSSTSYLDTFNPQLKQWEQHTVASVRIVASQERLLYKLRKSLFQGFSEEECPGLKEELDVQFSAPPNNEYSSDVIESRPKEEDSVFPEYGVSQKSPIREDVVLAESATVGPSGLTTLAPDTYQTDRISLPFSTVSIQHDSHAPSKRWPGDFTVAELLTAFHAIDSLLSYSSTSSLAIMTNRKMHATMRNEFGGAEEGWDDFLRRVEGIPPGKASFANGMARSPVRMSLLEGARPDTSGFPTSDDTSIPMVKKTNVFRE